MHGAADGRAMLPAGLLSYILPLDGGFQAEMIENSFFRQGRQAAQDWPDRELSPLGSHRDSSGLDSLFVLVVICMFDASW